MSARRVRTVSLAKKRFVPFLIVAAMFAILAVPLGATGAPRVTHDTFERFAPDIPSPTGNTVIDDCQAGGIEDRDGWLAATADLKLRQVGGHTAVVIKVRDARPDTYYTVWLRLAGTDSNGNVYGTSPLTGGRGTPLVASDDLPAMLATTGEGNGSDDQVNGFRTNGQGHARIRIDVDFPIMGGAYPFHRFPGFDPTDSRLPAENPVIHPSPLPGSQAPFTIRIASHCTDDVGHGLAPGAHENWFDWKFDG